MGVFRNIFERVVLFGCAKRTQSDSTTSESMPKLSKKDRTLLTAEFDFALSLLNKLSADKSCIVSPFSISLALSLVHSGTKGTARKEIEQLLLKGAANEEFGQHFSNLIENISNVTEGVEFQLANRVFVKNNFTLLDSYLSSIRDNYDAGAVSLDFTDKTGSAEAVNSFVNEVTHGKIEDIVKPEDFSSDLLRMILVNAVYMNAEWDVKFFRDCTQTGTFYTSETVEKEVEYLQDYRCNRYYYENEQFQLLSLKYVDERYRFNVFLPKEKFNLGKMQNELSAAEIQKILECKLKIKLLNIQLPKFKFEFDIRLASSLKALGVEGIFNPSEDLTGFAGTDDLFVSDILHKATIEVNEEGTIAAAATREILYGCGLIEEEPVDFFAHHPFMFCITFQNHPIFIGNNY